MQRHLPDHLQNLVDLTLALEKIEQDDDYTNEYLDKIKGTSGEVMPLYRVISFVNGKVVDELIEEGYGAQACSLLRDQAADIPSAIIWMEIGWDEDSDWNRKDEEEPTDVGMHHVSSHIIDELLIRFPNDIREDFEEVFEEGSWCT